MNIKYVSMCTYSFILNLNLQIMLTYAPFCDSHPCGQVSLDKNEFKRRYQTTVFVAGMAHDFQVFSQLIGYSLTLFV